MVHIQVRVDRQAPTTPQRQASAPSPQLCGPKKQPRVAAARSGGASEEKIERKSDNEKKRSKKDREFFFWGLSSSGA